MWWVCRMLSPSLRMLWPEPVTTWGKSVKWITEKIVKQVTFHHVSNTLFFFCFFALGKLNLRCVDNYSSSERITHIKLVKLLKRLTSTVMRVWENGHSIELPLGEWTDVFFKVIREFVFHVIKICLLIDPVSQKILSTVLFTIATN